MITWSRHHQPTTTSHRPSNPTSSLNRDGQDGRSHRLRNASPGSFAPALPGPRRAPHTCAPSRLLALSWCPIAAPVAAPFAVPPACWASLSLSVAAGSHRGGERKASRRFNPRRTWPSSCWKPVQNGGLAARLLRVAAQTFGASPATYQ
jgi:hypothetical protein